MGKSCVRFRKLEDLPVELIGRTIGSIGVDDFVGRVKEATSVRKSRKG